MKIAVGIFSFNRPEYLKKVIKALEKNDNNNISYYLFQDGGTDQASINKEIFKSSSLDGKIISRNKNYGFNKNFYYSFIELIENYSYVVMLEDDIVVSPYFLTLMKSLLKQFQYQNVAAIRIDRIKRCPNDAVSKYKNYLTDSQDISDWGSFGVYSNKWEKDILYHYKKYQNIIENNSIFPHQEVTNFFISEGFPGIQGRDFDAALTYSVLKAGYKQLSTIVPRVSHIGISGSHHYNNGEPNELYIFDSDKNPTEFIINV